MRSTISVSRIGTGLKSLNVAQRVARPRRAEAHLHSGRLLTYGGFGTQSRVIADKVLRYLSCPIIDFMQVLPFLFFSKRVRPSHAIAHFVLI